MDFSGIYPPLATPFRDEALDLPALRHNLRRYMGTGLRGVLALGSNGEAAFVDEDEAERFVAATREEIPADRVLLVGTGRQSTRATIQATRRAASAGADAALVITPHYFKSQMGTQALVQHFRAVADASPIPVLLYNVTVFTGLNLPLEAVVQLSAHPNIVGIKDSNGDVAQVADLVASTPEDFTVLVGAAPSLYPALAVGASGGIVAAAVVIPELMVKLFDLARAGQHEEARALQRRITPLARAVTATYGVPGLKAAMDLAGYVGGAPRGPLLPAPPEAVATLRRLLDELKEGNV
jgi:4-hydroxy-2-oxoglutarate aldolase